MKNNHRQDSDHKQPNKLKKNKQFYVFFTTISDIIGNNNN